MILPAGEFFLFIEKPSKNHLVLIQSLRAPSGPVEQDGLKEIKILITNHCPDCDNVPGHFDINQAPQGWNNPKIYWKKLDDSECL